MEANCDHGIVVGKQLAVVNRLKGGTNISDPRELARINDLIAKITSPRGYWERPIVDEEGNVVEGQHRLEVARRLGWTKVPILRIMDLGRVYGYNEMKSAAMKANPMGGDQIHQIVCHALDTLHQEGGSVEKAMEYSLGPAYDPAFHAALQAAKMRAGVV